MITQERNYKGLFLLIICILMASLVAPTSCTSPASTPAPQAVGKTIVVTSTADSGSGSLRQAFLDAQSGDTITFDPAVFPPNAPVTIYLSSSLPPVRQGDLTIDASNAGVILDGSYILKVGSTISCSLTITITRTAMNILADCYLCMYAGRLFLGY